MPNVSKKRLLVSIRKEKDPVARERLLACRYRKKGWSIRHICKIMVRPYSTVREYSFDSMNMLCSPSSDCFRAGGASADLGGLHPRGVHV